MSDNTISPDQQNRDRNRKRKALLAGGLVLGIGAAATLAAFTDGEFARGEFSTGKFDVVGSTTLDGEYTSHTSAEGAAIAFTQKPTNLTPGETVYAPFYMKTGEDSLGGTLEQVNPTITGGLDGLLTASVTYGASDGTCGENFGNSKITPLDPKGANTVQACLKVTLSSNEEQVRAVQDPSTTVVWQWTAESV